MKTPFEPDDLLDDVLSGPTPNGLRDTTLQATLRAVRRQRRLHHALRGASVMAVMGMVAVVIWQQQRPSAQSQVRGSSPNLAMAKPVAKTVPGTDIRVIDDEELLAMFPGRPVALMGPPEQRQFVLLDQKRVVKSANPSHAKGLHL